MPVKAYTATDGSEEVHLNQLHADCGARIQYKKTCPIHGEVTNDQIVSGHEYAKGQYVVIDPEELDRLRTPADKTVNIDAFVPTDAIAIYADRAFDRIPVLADALEDAGCTNQDILQQCRSGGEHVRGCWVVDLILSKDR